MLYSMLPQVDKWDLFFTSLRRHTYCE